MTAEDDITVRKQYGTQICVNTASSSILGTRKSQQDKVYVFSEEGRAIGIVCDGMGGLEGGGLASQEALGFLVRNWKRSPHTGDYPVFLREQAREADRLIHELKDETGVRMDAGTTVVMAVICGQDLYWLSVGDSRLYIIRGQEIFAANQPHNYREILENRLHKGQITMEEYQREESRADALTSFLGMGNITLMDVNERPFRLQSKDILLLCSDGLYRSLSDARIAEIVNHNRDHMQRAADRLTSEALGDKIRGQDNTSVVIMEFLIKNQEGGIRDEACKV